MTFGPSQPPTPSSIFINRCTWKSSQYYIVISRMTSFIRISQKLVLHQSKCICAIKRILSTTAMYVSSSSFMYLRISCCCDACLNSSDLRVGVTTLLNTIQLTTWLGIEDSFLVLFLVCHDKGNHQIQKKFIPTMQQCFHPSAKHLLYR